MTKASENNDMSNFPKKQDIPKSRPDSDDFGVLIVSEVKSRKASLFHLDPAHFPLEFPFQMPNTPQTGSIPMSYSAQSTFKKFTFPSDSIAQLTKRLTVDSIQTASEISPKFTVEMPSPANRPFEKGNSLGGPSQKSLIEFPIKDNSERLKEFELESLRFNGPPLKTNIAFKQDPKSDELLEKTAKKEEKASKCTCKKSFCLRLYCDCFAKGQICGPECNCNGCHNNESYLEVRELMIKETIAKNPLAFSSKYKKMNGEQKILHSRGCHCSKTGCVKKYCECFNAGTGCSRLCKCRDCKNDNIEIQDSEVKGYFEKVLRKRRKPSAFIQILDSKFGGNRKEQTN